LSSSITAYAVHAFFYAKVAGVRSSTNDVSPPVFTDAPPGCSLMDFLTLYVDDVITAVHRLPDKQGASDRLPTSLLRKNVDVLAPFLVELFTRSLLQGTVPTVFESAYIRPLLKKPDLDPAKNMSYRPISNLSVLSKTLERLVARELLDYLYAADLMRDLQSAYRVNHSTETAVLNVLTDILRAVDSGDLAALALLDLSAAFDKVDHETLLHRLKQSNGLGGRVPVSPQLSISFCSLWRNIIDQAVLRCPTWIGSWADSVSSVHRRSDSTGSCTRPGPPLLRRRHANIRLLSAW